MKKHYATQIAAECPDDPSVAKAMAEVLDRKGTLLTRAMERLLDDPHLLSGWLALNRKNYQIENGKLVWIRNPLGVLNDTYEYLNMAVDPKAPAAEVIWQHDHELLQQVDPLLPGAAQDLRPAQARSSTSSNEILKNEAPQGGYDADDLGADPRGAPRLRGRATSCSGSSSWSPRR